MPLEVRPHTSVLGAEVIGADLSRFEDDRQFAQIHQALLEHGVLAIRDQHITPEQHIAFSRRFGELEVHVMDQYLLPGHPEILLISNKEVNGKPIGLRDAGNEWHTDISYKERPALGSLLYALEIPPQGGDTLFADLYAAYDALTEEMKARISGLKAIHSYAQYDERSRQKGGRQTAMSETQKTQVPQVAHPLVRLHPETRRQALYVSPGLVIGIEGMDDTEAHALLGELNAHATQPRFLYQHTWRLDDVLFWDNRRTIHLATGYDPKYTRHMHRTTIKGDRPF
ncbi:MAG: TauD/TfdA dioxygenase family protein [Acidiferrobacterales bacterium]